MKLSPLLLTLAIVLCAPALADAQQSCTCDYTNPQGECMQETCIDPWQSGGGQGRMYYNDVTPGWRTYYFEDGSNYYFDDRYRGRDGECFDQSGDRTRCGSQFYYYDYTYDDYDDPSTYKYDIADWWIGGECFDYKINRYVPCFEDYRPPGYNREEDYWYYDYERSEGESNDYWDRRWQDYDDFLQNQYYWYYWND